MLRPKRGCSTNATIVWRADLQKMHLLDIFAIGSELNPAKDLLQNTNRDFAFFLPQLIQFSMSESSFILVILSRMYVINYFI